MIKSRLEDIEVGDIVNRYPDAEQGWFTVDAISTLFNGHLQLADDTEQLTIAAGHKDMVGVQLVEEVVLDDRGVIAPVATPTMVAAPMAPPAEVLTAPAEPPVPPDQPDLETLSEAAATSAPARGPVDLEAEAAAAAAIATEMDAPPAGTPRGAVPGVDLALVASLLEDLDVGEAPAISAVLSDEPMMSEPTPALPANAIAVDGGALPEKPSYKNPVVVPEGIMLPRRSRAA